MSTLTTLIRHFSKMKFVGNYQHFKVVSVLTNVQNRQLNGQVCMFHATTNDISVSVMPVYIDEKSDPQKHEYFWAYRVIIENKGERSVQLVSRYWHITNAIGEVEEVRGPGVVGEQPILKPGDSFEYTSGCPLKTPSGIMSGSYQMMFEDKSEIEVAIPAFSLDLPDDDPVYN